MLELLEGLNNIFGEIDLRESLRTDVLEYEDGFMILSDVPGILKENIKISYEDDSLVIDVKKNIEESDNNKYRLSERTREYKPTKVYIPGNVDFGNASAQTENGVLRIYLPKVKKVTRNITVE